MFGETWGPKLRIHCQYLRQLLISGSSAVEGAIPHSKLLEAEKPLDLFARSPQLGFWNGASRERLFITPKRKPAHGEIACNIWIAACGLEDPSGHHSRSRFHPPRPGSKKATGNAVGTRGEVASWQLSLSWRGFGHKPRGEVKETELEQQDRKQIYVLSRFSFSKAEVM